MSKLYAAFGEFEIPMRIGDPTSGWIPPVRRTRFKTEPLLGSIAMLKNNDALLVLVSLDVLCIDIKDADAFRLGIAEAVGTDYACVSVSATHNHSGPAMIDCYDGPKNPELVAEIGRLLTETARKLKDTLQPAVLGCGFTYENDITWNRRYILKNGYTWAHPQLDKMDVVCAEGPIDPQVGVVCVRDMDGLALGYIVNFACHPLFFGGQCIASPNYPGALRNGLKRRERPSCVTVFINGAAGDISHANPFDPKRTSAESVGERLAERSYETAFAAQYTDDVRLRGVSSSAEIQRRCISDEHITRAQRVLAGETDLVIDPSWHPVSSMPNEEFARELIALRALADREPSMTIPLQAMRIGDSVWGFTPGELFVRYGMEIKVHSAERLTFVGAYTNGSAGYIVTPEAVRRGGYEATPCGGSVAESSAGDVIVDGLCALLEKL